MMQRGLFLAIAGLLAATVAGLGQARADFELIYEPTPFNGLAATPGTFVYSAAFNTQLDTGTGQPAESLIPGSFVTLYDFPGLLTSRLNDGFASIFSLTQQNVGVNPAFTAAPDSATLPNFTLTYTGPTLTTNTLFTNVFTLTSSLTGTAPGSGFFGGQDVKATGPSAGSPLGSVGRITQPSAAVPEPASLAMLTLGLAAAGFVARSGRRTQA